MVDLNRMLAIKLAYDDVGAPEVEARTENPAVAEVPATEATSAPAPAPSSSRPSPWISARPSVPELPEDSRSRYDSRLGLLFK